MLLETVSLRERAFFIAGRLPESDLVLEHASASRQHAAIVHHRSGAVYLIDLGSAHGTFLNGERLSPREPRLWTDGTPCVFGASSRAYVLQMRPDGRPLVAPHASVAARVPDVTGAPGPPPHHPPPPSRFATAPPHAPAERAAPPPPPEENGGLGTAASGAVAIKGDQGAQQTTLTAGTGTDVSGSDAEAGESRAATGLGAGRP